MIKLNKGDVCMEDKKFTVPVYEDDNGKKYISAKHLNENINGVRIQETNNEKFNVTSGVPIENKIIDMSKYREDDELEEFDFDDDEPTFTEELKDLLSRIKRNIIKDGTSIKDVIKYNDRGRLR